MKHAHLFVDILGFEKCDDFDNFVKVKFAYYTCYKGGVRNGSITSITCAFVSRRFGALLQTSKEIFNGDNYL